MTYAEKIDDLLFQYERGIIDGWQLVCSITELSYNQARLLQLEDESLIERVHP